jgi:pimeloyl-ACP methyl ester carboxylesterase
MYLLIHKYLTNNDIYLYGISFGGAVALYLATVFQTKIRGLILENTFISITEMIKDVTGWNFVDKFQSFFSEKWDNVDSISRLEIPVLFFCSLNDTVITSRHMNELIKHTKSIHSVIRFDSDHNDLWEYDQNVNRMTSAFDKFIH